MKKNILITFGRSFLALEMARMFAKAGHRVIVVDSASFSISKYSNAVSAHYRLPSPKEHSKEYIEKLAAIAAKEKVDLLIPMWEDLCYVTSMKHLFPAHCTLFCPDFLTYHTLLNKWTFQVSLEKFKIPHPKTFLIEKSADLKEISFDVPYAFKACYSRAALDVFKVLPGQQPPHVNISAHNPWIAQQWIDGARYCTYSACRNGKVLAHAAYPVRYTIDGHSCVAFESIEHPGILEWVQNFVQKIGYTGQIAFDLIEGRDQVLYAIECNPRSTSGLLLLNDNPAFADVFFKNSHTVVTPKKAARKQIATGMAMYGWKHIDYTPQAIGTYFKDLFTTSDVVLRRSDLLPFFVQPYLFCKLAYGSRKLQLSIAEYFIHDLKWDGKPF